MSGERVLVVDDELSMREFLTILLERDGYVVEVASTAEQALLMMEEAWPELLLTDMNLPGASGLELLQKAHMRAARLSKDLQVVVVTGYGTEETAIEAMKLGAANYVRKPFNNDELRLVVRRALGLAELAAENTRLKSSLANHLHFGNLVGSSPAMMRIYDLIRRVMNNRINCLIIGESGTGKELIARAIHDNGQRSSEAFVPINCGAIPENLVESELFGHKKGSFTGAVADKVGLFEAADGGTVFLDEVNSLPLSAQVKLLRVLQEQRFTPVGSVREVSVNVRVIAASNADLEGIVREGSFREDLYYRLNVVQVPMPPLRARTEDIPELIRFFTRRYSKEYGKSVVGLSAEAMRLAQFWSYPGNVRELQNMMERAVALCPGSIIQPEDLPAVVRKNHQTAASLSEPEAFPEQGLDLDVLLARVEQKWLRLALEAADGNRTKAARLLKMSFRSFRYRLAKFDLSEGG
ncbi:MAG: sigma-54 dependent transcriptional regulator [Myxococcota bacterium]|nr:sigma-54 dependent transcriptional regulator [Myxococcota bacterium]